MHKSATGQFIEASSPTIRPQNGGHPSDQNPPPLEDIHRAPVGQSTPWPNAESSSENLFETQKDWPIPLTPISTFAPPVKTEAPPQVAVFPRLMDAPRQAAKNCTWEPHCPICKNEEEHREEDWDGSLQNQPRMHPQNLQAQTTQNPQPQNFQCPQPQTL